MLLKSKKWLLIIGAALLLFVVTGVNSIPRLDEGVNASWAQVENQYQRRSDLIPNLVETVKGYANFEKTTLTDVINARANATKVTISPEMLNNPEAMKNFEQAQGGLSSALSRLMVVVEKYPDLKANQQFLSLQSQLEGTENRIAVARRDYIETVRGYNIAVRTFPTRIWALIYGVQPKQVFAAKEGAENAPVVKF
jgi:LemA protein